MTARRISIDIETLPTRNESILQRLTSAARNKRPPKASSNALKMEWDTSELVGERIQEAIDETAVNPFLAEPVLVCLKADDNGIEVFQLQVHDGDHMKGLANRLAEIADTKTIWIGHNLIGFDLPVLFNSFIRYRNEIPQAFPHCIRFGKWIGRIFDTMQRAPGKTPFVGMETLCEAYDIELPEIMWDGIPLDGSRVKEAWATKAGRAAVIEYCKTDVLVTEQLYLAMTSNGKFGTWADDGDGVKQRLEEIEQSRLLSEGAKALAQKEILKSAGLWPA
jgi:hypothetical protein